MRWARSCSCAPMTSSRVGSVTSRSTGPRWSMARWACSTTSSTTGWPSSSTAATAPPKARRASWPRWAEISACPWSSAGHSPAHHARLALTRWPTSSVRSMGHRRRGHEPSAMHADARRRELASVGAAMGLGSWRRGSAPDRRGRAGVRSALWRYDDARSRRAARRGEHDHEHHHDGAGGIEHDHDVAGGDQLRAWSRSLRRLLRRPRRHGAAATGGHFLRPRVVLPSSAGS